MLLALSDDLLMSSQPICQFHQVGPSLPYPCPFSACSRQRKSLSKGKNENNNNNE